MQEDWSGRFKFHFAVDRANKRARDMFFFPILNCSVEKMEGTLACIEQLPIGHNS